ncbi:MAG: MATE family efflux transporter [Dehalococcoidia bacterium]
MIREILSSLADKWSRKNGYKQTLWIAYPLILSTSAFTIQVFVDRMFLSWYSPQALAAALPTAVLSFNIVSFFMGTSQYVGTFVAQYMGAKSPEKIGNILWQGIYFSGMGGIILFILSFMGEPIFNFIGHDPLVKEQQISYWQFLAISGIFQVQLGALTSFFNGRGKTYPVMWSSFISTFVNICFNYCLIFGNFGFPEMGIQGAGLSTLIATFTNVSILSILIFSSKNNQNFNVRSSYQFNYKRFKRLVNFGMPNGFTFFLNMTVFTVFVLLVGRIGIVELAATNVAMNIAMLAFMPMIGLGISVMVQVGQSIGANDPVLAKRATYTGLQISFMYLAFLGVFYLFFPQILIYPYQVNASSNDFDQIAEMTKIILRFVTVWGFFDALGIIISAGLKGAGDTKFIMLSVAVIGTFVAAIPAYIAIEILSWGIYSAFFIGTIFMATLGITYLIRFRGGKWQTMKVIETESN